MKRFAVLKSSGGWPDICKILDTREAAEAVVKKCIDEEFDMLLNDPDAANHVYCYPEKYVMYRYRLDGRDHIIQWRIQEIDD